MLTGSAMEAPHVTSSSDLYPVPYLRARFGEHFFSQPNMSAKCLDWLHPEYSMSRNRFTAFMLPEFESRSIFSLAAPQLQITELMYRKRKVVDLIPAKTQAKESLSCFVNIVHCFNVQKWFVLLWKSHGKQQKIMHSDTLWQFITLSAGLCFRSEVINPWVHQPCILAAYIKNMNMINNGS